MVLIYSILIVGIFLWKPHLFHLKHIDDRMKRKKLLMLTALFMVVAILTYYIKIYLEMYL